tara:strand:+ start:204 stop:725 length:522 start_codon:yes stop_codon:yes gene_type:complete
MTKKLEEVFGFSPESDDENDNTELKDTTDAEVNIEPVVAEEIKSAQAVIDMASRIDTALPTVTDMAGAERELDKLADKAEGQSDRLMDLGFNVDDRNAGKVFEVAATLLKVSVDAKVSKLEKKLKMVELQLRKAKLDQSDDNEETNVIDADSTTLANRNELVQAILNRVGQNK